MSYANIQIIGNAADKPVLRTGKNGDFATVSVAVNEGSGDDRKTTWFDVSFNGKLGEKAVELINKGDQVFIPGSFSRRDVEGKGVYLSVRADSFRVFSKVPAEAEAAV